MKPKVSKCIMCGKPTKGRGQYHFTYLGETVNLFGHGAGKVMNYIKGEKC